ncbi:hypothetical protein HYC85_008896 [Camellia sinensis]|uniref:S-protein homolog n=1 Tax=Camellia sinensis TaxID=4442 RepID=A0A7J7HT63_CAMSI|nr:hypothetical protein HYC85_008896 [Camellia sinensis]
MDSHMRLTLLGCLVLVLGFVSGTCGLISHNVMKKINVINKEGPYLGIVVPNSFEMSPLLESPSFVVDHNPYLDFSDTEWSCHTVGEDTVWWCHNIVEDTVWLWQTVGADKVGTVDEVTPNRWRS